MSCARIIQTGDFEGNAKCAFLKIKYVLACGVQMINQFLPVSQVEQSELIFY